MGIPSASFGLNFLKCEVFLRYFYFSILFFFLCGCIISKWGLANSDDPCKKLNPGEQKTMYASSPFYKRLEKYAKKTHYTVKRETDGTYTLPLYLRFIARSDYDGPYAKEEVNREYKQRARKCLSQANKRMTFNGQKIKILIQDFEKGTDGRDLKKSIFIASKYNRSNMLIYKSGIDCSIMIHEILHLYGLCDEYHEVKSGFYTDVRTGEIKNFQSKKPPENTPLSSVSKFDCRVIRHGSIMGNNLIKWENTDESLLEPDHVSKLLYGTCESNKKINECYDLAYSHSSENIQVGSIAVLPARSGCQEERKACEKMFQDMKRAAHKKSTSPTSPSPSLERSNNTRKRGSGTR